MVFSKDGCGFSLSLLPMTPVFLRPTVSFSYHSKQMFNKKLSLSRVRRKRNAFCSAVYDSVVLAPICVSKDIPVFLVWVFRIWIRTIPFWPPARQDKSPPSQLSQSLLLLYCYSSSTRLDTPTKFTSCMESRLDSSSTDHGSSSSIERRDPDSEAKHDDHDEQQGVHSFSKAVDEGESRIGLAETSHSRAGTRFRSVQSDSSVPMLRRAMEHECHDEEPQGQEPGQEKVERDQTTTGWTTRDTSAEAMADGAGRGETATTRDSATLVRPPLSTPALDHKAATVTVMESSSSSPAFGQLQFSSTPSEMRSSTASSLDQSRSTPVTEYSAVNSRTGMAAAVQNCASSTSGKSVKSSSVKEFDRFSLPTAEDIAGE